MSDEATEEKKEKKKKPKKEKKPKVKKEKPPKPKKEKKAKNAEGEEGAEGGQKKKGIPKLILILVPVFVVLIVGGIFVFMKLRGGKAPDDAPPVGTGDALTGQVEKTERAKGDNAKKNTDAAPEEPPPDAEPVAEGEPEAPQPGAEVPPPDAETPPPPEKKVDISVSMTTSQSIDYFRSLSPATLGLPGESMDDYDIFASEHLILVDNVPCKEFRVYSFTGRAGTNTVEGIYLLTQRGERKLYRLDEATDTITELEWKPPATPEPELPPEGEPDAENAAPPEEGTP